MKWVLDKTLGYLYILDKTSPYASKQGKVYQHIYVMCQHLGRKLNANECVHHIDRNKQNNSLQNLLLLTYQEHALLHAIEDRGYTSKILICPICGKRLIISSKSKQIYCSYECAYKDHLRFEINKEDLEILVWQMPTTHIAKLYGVSDVAIAKRCKKLGIKKPPRGYWAKLYASK